MGRKLALVHKQKYPAESKAAQLHEGRTIKLRARVQPRTFGQEFYLNCLQECTITLATGPAGTGKSWMATNYALQLLLDNKVERIVVTKPIMEAGEESIGFLPGEIDDKVAPHFRSVLECFHDHIGSVMTQNLLDREKIVFLPIAYARGLSITNAVVIADEAQNLTRKGMKLLLSRIGQDSIMIVNGDDDQCDLPRPSDSGLAWAVECLRGKDPEIGIVQMTDADIQRHPLIRTILTNLR